MRPPLVVIGGPTASGKSALAVALAQRFDGEIVNADSQQVYRGLDIGTGKPTEAERAGIPHHLYDIADPWEQLDAAQFAARADAVIDAIAARGHRPIVVGGTGLWIRALLKGLVDAPPRDPAVRERLESEALQHGLAWLHARLAEVDPDGARTIRPTDPIRLIRSLEVFELGGVPLSELHRRHALEAPRYPALRLAMDLPRPLLDQRIRARAAAMFDHGLLDETRRALEDERARRRIEGVMGFREAAQHLRGERTREEAVEAAFIAQRQYAKRQGTWLRGEAEWRWIDATRALAEAAVLCEEFYGGRAAPSPGRIAPSP